MLVRCADPQPGADGRMPDERSRSLSPDRGRRSPANIVRIIASEFVPALKAGETCRQLLQLIDQRMGVVFDDQIKKFRRGLL